MSIAGWARQGGAGVQVQQCGQPLQEAAVRADGSAASDGTPLHPLYQAQLPEQVSLFVHA